MPPTNESLPVGGSIDIVNRFIERLSAADELESGVEAAADLWSGYPNGEEEKRGRLQEFVEQNEWLLDNRVRLDEADAWSFPSSDAMTAVAITDVDQRGTVAVVVDRAGTIQRIQLASDFNSEPELLTNGVAVPGLPVEGGVVAYLDGQPIPADQIGLNFESNMTFVLLPDSTDADRQRLLIVPMATTEFPTAFAFLVPSR